MCAISLCRNSKSNLKIMKKCGRGGESKNTNVRPQRREWRKSLKFFAKSNGTENDSVNARVYGFKNENIIVRIQMSFFSVQPKQKRIRRRVLQTFTH